jgi:type IV pilus assembly protein PilA
MKKEKGFTLVEILAVVIIIGILTLVTIPTIDSMIEKNRQKLYSSQINTIKSSLKMWADQNALYLPKTGEDPLILNLGILKLTGFIDKDVKNPKTDACFPNDMLITVTPVKEGYAYSVDAESGSEPTSADCLAPSSPNTLYLVGGNVSLILGDTYKDPGFIAIDSDGKIVNSQVSTVIKDVGGVTVPSIDTYNVSKAPYTITYTYGATVKTRTVNIKNNNTYVNGTAVYFNPVTGVKCTAGQAVSTTGTKTGCMKWYAFNDEGSVATTVNLLLDHNTTAVVAWNSGGASFVGATNVLTQLASDTSSWAGVTTRTDSYTLNNGVSNYTISYNGYKARLITASEVAKITGNNNFVETATLWTNWNFFDSNNQTQTATSLGASKYAWLFDYTKNCASYGCNIVDDSNYGYWTATASYDDAYHAWILSWRGGLGADYISDTYDGVRPVITVPKSLIR